MFTKSIWHAFGDSTDFPALREDIEVEVAIVGGGITGISTGLRLASNGRRVAVLEARKVGLGTTGHSTGNLYFTIDKILSTLRSKYDTETVRRVAVSRNAAVEQISSWVHQYGLDCDFHRRNWYLYSADEQHESKIEKELNAAREAGLSIAEATQGEIPLSFRKGVRVSDQAQINPLRYVQQLAKAAARQGCQIYENSRVTEFKKEGEFHEIHTTGGRVRARHLVLATHTPKGVRFVHTLLGPYREYGIAVRLRSGNYPEGIFWGYHDSDEQISIRSYRRDEQDFLLVIGKPHKVGQSEDNVWAIRQLEAFARAHFDVEEVLFKWGGQHYRPADLLPYIGETGTDNNLYIATGFSTDGLTYGTLSAMIISDLISGTENAWADLYSATRVQPLKSAKEFIKENVDVASHLVRNLFGGGVEKEELAGIAAGEGKVIELEGEKLAVYRDPQGQVQLVSAVCPHMGCLVHWNNAEISWDCPCHGSRFETNGSVIEGPSLKPLTRMEAGGEEIQKKSPD